MSLLICPECGAENSIQSERCIECDASLAAVVPSEIPDLDGSEHDAFDLLQEAENDLPGLLSALKQNGDIDANEDDREVQEVDKSPINPKDKPDTDDTEQDEELPEWLNRIRQRASEESDSLGEITQKISAARESLEEEKSTNQHENFKSWIKNIRQQSPDIPAGKDSKEVEPAEDGNESFDTDPEWLSKIRKAKGVDPEKETTEPVSISDQGGDSLLQWLVALEDGEETSQDNLEETSEIPIADGEETRQSQIIDRGPGGDSTQQVSTYKPPLLNVSREEQIQADQLSATIVDERASRPLRESDDRSSTWAIRLFIAVLLITGLSLSLFVGGQSGLPQGLLQPQNEAALLWAEGLPTGSSVLLVFDYQSAFADELSLVAKPILKRVIQAECELSVLSSTAAGVLLSRQVLNDIVQYEELDIIDLGYYPVSAYGAFSLANRTVHHWQFTNLPEMPHVVSADGYDSILILSDSYEDARAWIEQFSALSPDTPINLLVTAQAGPLLLPYWESGQVTGMISGVSEAAGIESLQGEDMVIANRWLAYRMGIIMLIALLVIGAIFVVNPNSDDEGQGHHDPK